MGVGKESSVSSRIEDLRDLARMLDEGKISQREYEIVKTELLEAPAEEWSTPVAPPNGAAPAEQQVGEEPVPDEESGPDAGWLTSLRQVPITYRAALAVAVLVLLIGGFIASRSDATGTVMAVSDPEVSAPAAPAQGSLGFLLDDLTSGWNAVEHPPLITTGILTSPEPGELDSFHHRFDESAMLAGAYDPADGSVYALMVRSGVHHESISNLYVHLCYLLHPGSQDCLEFFIEETGMFGRAPAELASSGLSASWEFEGHEWEVDIAGDIETIRVQGDLEP